MTSWSYDLSRMRIFCPAMPSYLFSYRFAAGPRTRACRSRCARDRSRRTDVLSKDLGHIARSMRDGTHGPPQRRWGIRAILSEFHPRVQTQGAVLACETTDRVATVGAGATHGSPTVTKKLPYPALGRVATGHWSQRRDEAVAQPREYAVLRGSTGTTPLTVVTELTDRWHALRAPTMPRIGLSEPPITAKGPASNKRRGPQCRWISSESYLSRTQRVIHLMILVTRPEPTVRPPSRIAKPRPGSMAMG